MKLTNSYRELGREFYQEIRPTHIEHPHLVLWNKKLAGEFLLPDSFIANAANYLSGNQLIPESIPIAQAYAGHQFGGFSPQLGDGRAHLLGEIYDLNDNVYDLQLKGSGQTRFSRRGDGRCAVKPAAREFIMSEAMHALGIATTRSLSVVTTGETLYRGIGVPGAVVSRVASSHIRVGTFQYFAARNDVTSLRKLLSYSISRHYPEIDFDPTLTENERVACFLQLVIDRQIETIVGWMRVGFIHGVMNTDNMTISGETIDYGPCAMMGVYDPLTVYSSIDEQGRYAYGNQPVIAQWNLARLAETLLPLIEGTEDEALALLEPLVIEYGEKYQNAYYTMMAGKLGLVNREQDDNQFIDKLLSQMQKQQLDYTDTFIQLMSVARGAVDHNLEKPLDGWFRKWKKRVHNTRQGDAIDLMQRSNPVVIPRNHHVEKVLSECQDNDNYQPAEDFLYVLRSPYKPLVETILYQDLPPDGDRSYRTFCGT
ncbi:protein adenylyltransferase SelO [Vibrio sp. SCSIO 43137]|uniref:protein adenylyltransferase SelO n=1 Tax=Vibrio sp. SCSIO 43137 TaxID=3021011 RepID=UPI00230733E7|nr:YdiU family protein [Vibrio sp. SCSIO 43137]WCE32543.1 YdiU family protein [Vibrio sp. SCSIO 43137]